MSTLPATPSVADEVDESRRLLAEAQEHNRWSDTITARKAQASAQMATGHVLLAIGEEIATVRAQLDQLAGIRWEVAGLAGAVRELTATIAKATDPIAEAAGALPGIAEAIGDIPGHGEVLGDIATGIESLVAAVDEGGRWPWRRRRSARPETALTAATTTNVDETAPKEGRSHEGS